MKPRIYCAGCNSLHKTLDAKPIADLNELIPFLDVRKKIDTFGKPRNAWFIDSSAFSIFTRGVNVTLDEYITFLHAVLGKYGDERDGAGGKIGLYAGLDVIGDPVAGDINQLKMEAAGLKHTLPTYHRGDSIDFLKKFLDRGYDYIAIGGMAIADEYTSAESLFPFLDAIFREICDPKGRPRIKTHLFGIAAPKAIMRYPVASADATSWMQPGSFGSIMLPKLLSDGKPDWFSTMVKIRVSAESWELSEKCREPGGHYLSSSPVKQETIRTFLERYGVAIEQVSAKGGHEARNLWNLTMTLEMARALPDKETFDHMDELDFNFL